MGEGIDQAALTGEPQTQSMPMRPIFLPDTAMNDDQAIVEEFYRYIYYRHVESGIFGSILGTGSDADVYAALYYSGQVRNGGHYQFIANADDDSRIFEAALAGLAEIGAHRQRALLSKAIAWAEANPPPAESWPPELDELNKHFFDAQDIDAVETRAAAWIKAYPDLRVVSGAEFMALLQGKAAAAASSISRPGGARIGLLDRVMTTIFGR